MFIFRILNTVPYTNQAVVKDVMACLHSYFTCNLLIGLAILLSYKQFGGNPIECMTPLGFTKAWNEYVESYCFSEDTYYVSFNNQIVDFSPEQKKSLHVSYYQWMPFFLLFQCACFKFPTFLWKYFASQSGVKVGEILRLATNEANAEAASRAENIRSLCLHLQCALRFQDRLKKRKLTPHKYLLFLNLKYSSHYIACIYFMAKFAFLLNVIGQTALLNGYLFPDRGPAFGFSVWHNLLHGNTTWRESGLFPRVTLCDFEIREMGQSQNHTIQCVLLLNIFTEKVFVVLWAWYIILGALTLCNFSSWTLLFLNRRFSEHFIFNHLEMSGERIFDTSSPSTGSQKGTGEVQQRVARFIRKYLKSDGILILRLIAQHADVVFTTELIYKLWESHYAIEQQRETLRRTEKPWQEHLRRFEEKQRISDATDQNIYMALPNSPPLYQKRGIHHDRVQFESFVGTPEKHMAHDASAISMQPFNSAGAHNRRSSYGSRHASLRRTLSAESTQSYKFADSSDSANEDRGMSSRKSSSSRKRSSNAA